jgi:S-adenosylmethionine decarboxylase
MDSGHGGSHALHKGKHLLIDCRGVPRALCLDDGLLLETLADAARLAGATVISQIRYRFAAGSPPGCTAVVMLDESHCSVHTYADLGLMALDVFTCGATDPHLLWRTVRDRLGIEHAEVRELPRFSFVPAAAASATA